LINKLEDKEKMSHMEIDCGTDNTETGSKLYSFAVFVSNGAEERVPIS
jgi:hypothetical protein